MIRPATAADQAAIAEVLGTIELFPPEILPEQLADYLDNPDTDHFWFVHEAAGTVTGFCYCVPEALTDRTYNLLAIGVRADRQGKGVGSDLMRHAESALAAAGKRLLLVDTSGTEDFALVRRFYVGLGYTKEAVIRDYWGVGDDKVVFWKGLG